jgi:RNA-directed DNA polymerase
MGSRTAAKYQRSGRTQAKPVLDARPGERAKRADRVRQAAQKDKQLRFTALLHHVTIDLLRGSYYGLKRRAAAGVDGVTWQAYGDGLEERLADLHGRIHRGAYRAKPPRMGGNGHWVSRPWKTKSSRVR